MKITDVEMSGIIWKQLTKCGKTWTRNANLLLGGADNFCIAPLQCKTFPRKISSGQKIHIEIIVDEKGRYGNRRPSLPLMDILQSIVDIFSGAWGNLTSPSNHRARKPFPALLQTLGTKLLPVVFCSHTFFVR